MRSDFHVLGRGDRNELFYWGFIQGAHAENLQDFEQGSLAFGLLSRDGHQRVNAQGHPDLRAYRVLRGPVKRFDAQVLLDPFEEQFHLPALPVKFADDRGGQAKVIGQNDQAAGVLRVVAADAPQSLWISFAPIEGGQLDDLVAAHVRAGPHRQGMQAGVSHAPACRDDEPSPRALDGVQARVIGIAPVQQVKRTRLKAKGIQPKQFLKTAGRDFNRGGQGPAQVQLDVKLEGGPRKIKARPGAKMQPPIKDAGVPSVKGLGQLTLQRIVHIETAGLAPKTFRQSGGHAPVARMIGVGQRAAAHRLGQPQVVEMSAARIKAGLNVTEAFTPGQLGKSHADKLAPARELADLVIPAQACNAALELLGMNNLKKLSQDEFSGVHPRTMRLAKRKQTSNRSHFKKHKKRLPHVAKLSSPASMTGHLWSCIADFQSAALDWVKRLRLQRSRYA